ncbi:acetyltransferase [Bizionia myxarmorum]|uniref:Acetyltransferase n=1 Tax=Bizionia myxarmorum TaxID=291186 RepID=A0A5D0RBL9_9FLAO|nr:acetyltransferase [Bizionia myxarmorum]TYB79050.1 acetyltransferase [Bizionia myxarmorum]
MKKQILIAGTGGFSKEVLCLITDLGRYDDVLGFIEPDFIIEKGDLPDQIMGKPILPYSQVDPEKHLVSIAIGDSIIRERAITQLPKGVEFITLIHPTAVVSEWVTLGEGSVVCAGTIITCDIKIGKHVQLNLNTTIGHDCVIGDFFTTAPNVNISGNCTFGNHVYFGTASSIKQGVSIIENVTIGMGAIVTRDITEPGVYIGIPAKPLKK